MLIYLLVFINGFVIMGVELSASRLVAPYFGTTLVVWTNLIGAIMLFLSIGYYLGGEISVRRPQPRVLYSLTLAAGVTVAFLPMAARPLMALVSGAATAGSFFAVMGATFLLLAPSTILMGCVVPFAVRLRCREAEDASRTAGRIAGTLYAVATVGSIIGVFLPVLFLMPTFGTRATFFILSAALTVVSLVGIARPLPLLLLAAYLPVALTLGKSIGPSVSGEVLLEERETPYNYVRIFQKGDRVQMSINEGQLVYSQFVKGELLTHTYRDLFTLAPLFSGRYAEKGYPSKILVLGIGGGIASQQLRRAYPEAEINGVEIDPVLPELGEKWMGLEGALDRLVIDDGRNFLRGCENEYDVIVADAYSQIYIPFHLATVEFFEEVRQCLAPGGVMALNVAWRTAENHELLTHVANTASTVFQTVHLATMRHRYNVLLFASGDELDERAVDKNMAGAAGELEKAVLEEVVSGVQRYGVVEGVFPFTDDWAPVEMMTDRVWYAMFWD
ncbi:MAG: fused MFS/spermidine synthase [bacterium]